MVKGITKQVIVIKGTIETPFEQAIFLVRDDVLSKGGITEDALLKEARLACSARSDFPYRKGILWSFGGAAAASLIWLLSVLI